MRNIRYLAWVGGGINVQNTIFIAKIMTNEGIFVVGNNNMKEVD